MFKKILLLSFLCFTTAGSCLAECDFDPGSNGKEYRVRNVSVDTLFGSVPKELRDILARHRGEVFRATGGNFTINSASSDSSVSQFQAEVRAFLEKKSESLPDGSFGLGKKGGIYVRATFSVPCVKVVPPSDCSKDVVDGSGTAIPNCVDVIVKYTVIPVNTANPASNILDLARSNQLRFYRELPRPLLALDPILTIENDTTYGASLYGAIKTDLLNLPSLLAGNKPDAERRTTLLLTANGRKSLELPFFSVNTSILFSRSRPGGRLTNLLIGGGYSTEQDKRGSSNFQMESTRFRADAQMKVPSRLVNQLTLGVDYQRKRNRLEPITGPVESSVENFVSSRLITDGNLANGFLRAAAWIDHASPADGESYTRFSTQLGYSKNFSLKRTGCSIETDESGPRCVFDEKNPPVLGVELLFGLGRSWGTVPEHARFFGGNGGGNFLYDSHDAQTMIDAPTGPLFKSIGRNQAGARFSASGISGGTSYEFLSTSVSIPIKSWSRPLIPSVAIIDRPTDGGCEGCSSLKTVLKNQVASGKEFYLDVLAWQSLTDQQREDFALGDKPDPTPEEKARFEKANAAYDAARLRFTPKANAVWEEITPTVEFIADRANLYSVKPLVMFDIARVSVRGYESGKVRLGLGGGLQVNVVVAKFELGYIRTVRGLPGDGSGNFIIRTIFEKLF